MSVAHAAQPQSPGDRELIRDRQERLLQEQQQRLEELQRLPGERVESTPETLATDGRCFDIRQIELQGAQHLHGDERDKLIAPYQGRCLAVAQLNELLKAITTHYLSQGRVTTRAYLPQQNLSSGTLRIIVVEGKLEMLERSELASDRELAMAFPGRTGETLNLRELEQLVEQLNRLPSRQAELELVPGEQVGGSRLRLKGTRDKAWRISATRHNDGTLSTGEQQMGLGLDWDSPLGLADQLGLRTTHDVVSDKWRRSDSQGLFYSLPWGWWTFSYSYNQSDYRTRGQGSAVSFTYDGDSQSHQLSAERVVHRDSLSKTALNVGLSHQRTNNYVDNVLTTSGSTRLSEAQFGFNHGRRIGSGFVNLDAGWQHGIGAFDAQGAGHPRGSGPVARYNKYSLTLSYLQPFQVWGEHLSFDSLVHGQRSEDTLYSPQRLSLGGLSSVRGFKEQSLSGDNGGYWRNQLRWRRPVTWQPLQSFIREYGLAFAYDIGVIQHGRYNDGASGRMSGNAVELSARGQYFAASVSFAHSLERPGALADRETPIHFRLDAFF